MLTKEEAIARINEKHEKRRGEHILEMLEHFDVGGISEMTREQANEWLEKIEGEEGQRLDPITNMMLNELDEIKKKGARNGQEVFS